MLSSLNALAHDGRLAVWQALLAHEPHGLEAGKLADALAMPANTLSTQLAILSRAGLVAGERRGRSIVYRANPHRMAALSEALTALCCGSRPQLCFPQPQDRLAMTGHRPFNVLFLCTGNTARSILAESILRKLGSGQFVAYSAGSQPKGTVNPWALRILEEEGFPVDGMRSKSWDEFAAPGAPEMDFVFTVCDSAAGEPCPVWPGQPVTAHWGIEDPAAVDGGEIDKRRAFYDAFRYMRNRIAAFTALPVRRLDRLALAKQVGEIGRQAGASADAERGQ